MEMNVHAPAASSASFHFFAVIECNFCIVTAVPHAFTLHVVAGAAA